MRMVGVAPGAPRALQPPQQPAAEPQRATADLQGQHQHGGAGDDHHRLAGGSRPEAVIGSDGVGQQEQGHDREDERGGTGPCRHERSHHGPALPARRRDAGRLRQPQTDRVFRQRDAVLSEAPGREITPALALHAADGRPEPARIPNMRQKRRPGVAGRGWPAPAGSIKARATRSSSSASGALPITSAGRSRSPGVTLRAIRSRSRQRTSSAAAVGHWRPSRRQPCPCAPDDHRDAIVACRRRTCAVLAGSPRPVLTCR